MRSKKSVLDSGTYWSCLDHIDAFAFHSFVYFRLLSSSPPQLISHYPLRDPFSILIFISLRLVIASITRKTVANGDRQQSHSH